MNPFWILAAGLAVIVFAGLAVMLLIALGKSAKAGDAMLRAQQADLDRRRELREASR